VVPSSKINPSFLSRQSWSRVPDFDHHPESCLTWGRAAITITAHSVGGLSEADFVFAARADQFVG